MSTISRRTFLGTVAATATTACATAPRRAKSARKPNLLFLWTDEQRADTMAAYGNPRIQTPNLNKLASECVRFEHACVSQPVCTPSRSTVMTGLWPHRNGCTQNNIALPENAKTFPELLADPAYRTGYFGKWHLGDEIFAQHGFEEWQSIEDMYWQFYREGRDTDRKSDYCEWLKSLGYTPDSERGDFSRGRVTELPIEHAKPKFLEQRACDFLRRHRNEPFALYVNFLEPHMPFRGPLNGLHRPEDVILPINFNDPLEENEPEAYRERLGKYTDGLYSGRFDLNTEEGWRRLIANYWGLVAQVDRSVGVILDTLEDLGLADDTVVVYTSDHGDMMGAHRLVEKSLMYHEAMRVPWLMRIPKQGRREQVMPGYYSHIDLVPTLLDLMGAQPPAELPGTSLAPAMQAGAAPRAPIFVQWNAPQEMPEGRNPAGAKRDPDRLSGPSTRAVVALDGWKLCLNDRDRSQLFNLRDDPGETTNLFGRPEHRDTTARLTTLIHAWQEKNRDTLRLAT